jgi:hypothetical protein
MNTSVEKKKELLLGKKRSMEEQYSAGDGALLM